MSLHFLIKDFLKHNSHRIEVFRDALPQNPDWGDWDYQNMISDMGEWFNKLNRAVENEDHS